MQQKSPKAKFRQIIAHQLCNVLAVDAPLMQSLSSSADWRHSKGHVWCSHELRVSPIHDASETPPLLPDARLQVYPPDTEMIRCHQWPLSQRAL